MSPAEMDALMVSEVSPIERSVYMYLRRHMDYKTGLVGMPRRISYQSIREHIEYIPGRGSKDEPYKPSKDQIKRLLRKLEKHGFIERQHKNHLKEPMVFKLVFATTDLNRPDEERQGSAMRAAPQGAPQQNPVSTRDNEDSTATMSAKGAPWDERHTSVPSDINNSLSNAREKNSPELTTGAELEFNQEFLAIAGLTGLKNSEPEYIEDVFNHFRLYPKHQNTLRNHAQWKSEWRSWVAREKLYGGKYATKANSKPNVMHSRENQNPTAKLYRRIQKGHDEFAGSDEGKAYFEGQDDFE